MLLPGDSHCLRPSEAPPRSPCSRAGRSELVLKPQTTPGRLSVRPSHLDLLAVPLVPPATPSPSLGGGTVWILWAEVSGAAVHSL